MTAWTACSRRAGCGRACEETGQTALQGQIEPEKIPARGETGNFRLTDLRPTNAGRINPSVRETAYEPAGGRGRDVVSPGKRLMKSPTPFPLEAADATPADA